MYAVIVICICLHQLPEVKCIDTFIEKDMYNWFMEYVDFILRVYDQCCAGSGTINGSRGCLHD